MTKTRRWSRVRVLALRRDDYRCRQCGAHGRLEVDHIRPVRTHPELSFELDNLQTLCPPCHSRKTRVECGHRPVNSARLEWRAALTNVPRNEESHA